MRPFDVGIEALPPGERGLRAEHDLRRLGGELAAGLGRSGLHDHGPALHGPRDVERTADGQVLSLVGETCIRLGSK